MPKNKLQFETTKAAMSLIKNVKPAEDLAKCNLCRDMGWKFAFIRTRQPGWHRMKFVCTCDKGRGLNHDNNGEPLEYPGAFAYNLHDAYMKLCPGGKVRYLAEPDGKPYLFTDSEAWLAERLLNDIKVWNPMHKNRQCPEFERVITELASRAEPGWLEFYLEGPDVPDEEKGEATGFDGLFDEDEPASEETPF